VVTIEQIMRDVTARVEEAIPKLVRIMVDPEAGQNHGRADARFGLVLSW
jgi:hypothetical protein